MNRKTKSATATLEIEAPEAPSNWTDHPLLGVALLKAAMEFKKSDGAALEDILAGVLQRMGLPQDALQGFLEQNGGLLRAASQKSPRSSGRYGPLNG